VAVLPYGGFIKIRQNDKETICVPYKLRSEAFAASHPKPVSSPYKLKVTELSKNFPFLRYSISPYGICKCWPLTLLLRQRNPS